MKLYEFQGKRIFKQYEIPVPSGELIYPNSDLPPQFSPPLVLKSQVLTGGRGKAGGILIWDGKQNINKLLEKLYKLKINNEKVQIILAETSVDILREIYVSFTFNKTKATPVLIVGVSGGMDIEKSAKENKEQVFFIEFNSLLGILDFQIRYAAKKLGIKDVFEFKKIILAMYQIFKDLDATIVEINPLAMTSSGLMAIDSKIEIDDQSYFKHHDLFQQLKNEIKLLVGEEQQTKSEEDTITYVPLSGNIGVVSDGAGTGLLTLDMLSKYGGDVASFCELGGITSPEVVYKALKKVHQDPNVKSILVVLIGGFNRMDEMAEGIVRFHKDITHRTPLFIRMCGTKEEEGKKLMQDANIPIDNNLLEAVKKAINKAMEN